MKEKVIKSALLISILTIFGKIIGFLRTIVIAYLFGADSTMDAYNLANGFVLNVLYALSTAIALAFLPHYIEKKVNRGEKEAADFSSKVLSVMTVVALVISVVVLFGAPVLAKVTAPGYKGEQLQQVALYLRILSLGMVFSLLARLLKSILDAEQIYGYGAFSGIIYSVTTIVFAIAFHASWGVMSLLIAIPVAYFLQFVFLAYRTRKSVKIRVRFDVYDKDVLMLIKVAIPVLLSNTTVEINQLVDRMLASGTTEGAVSALSYSSNLSDLVVSIISESLITVFFTEFSNEAVKGNIEAIKGTLKQGISVLCLLLLPISVITIMFGEDIVRIVYFRGAFNEKALSLTTIAIILYAACWIAINMERLFTKAFLAFGDTKLPMIISISSVAVNIIFSVLCVHFIGFAGIILGTVIAEIVSVGLNLFFLRKKIGTLKLGDMKIKLIKMILATIVTGIVLVGIQVVLANSTALVRFASATVIGLLVYSVMLIIFRCEEIQWVIGIAKKKIKK